MAYSTIVWAVVTLNSPNTQENGSNEELYEDAKAASDL